MSSWLITSFNLPVALAAGRLLRLSLAAVSAHPIGVLLGASGLTLIVGASTALVRRRALRRASPS
jgi:hypothetical protein